MNDRTSQPNEKLRQARRARGWSLWKAAAVMGLNVFALSRWERGKALPSNYELYILCQFLRKTPEELGLRSQLTSGIRSYSLGSVTGGTSPPTFSRPEFTLRLAPQQGPQPEVSSDDLLGKRIPTAFQLRLNCFLFALFWGIMPLAGIVIAILLLVIGGGSGLLILLQMLILTTVVCIIPTIVSKLVGQHRRFLRTLLDCVLFLGIFFCFYLWIFGLPLTKLWALYVFVILLLIESGGHVIEWYKETTLKRLMRSNSFQRIEMDAHGFQKMFRREVILYASFPLGNAAGTILGIFMHRTPSAIFMLCLQLVLIASLLILLYFLLLGFYRMCNPMYRECPVAGPQADTEKPLGRFFKVFQLFVPERKTRPDSPSQKQQDLDFACDISAIRKIYLYDMLHNSILLVVFTALLLSIWGVSFDYSWLIIALLCVSLFFTEIPYARGQYFLHLRILNCYNGTAHAELAKQLAEYAPCFPLLPFLISFMTPGTLGGFLFFLLNLIVQSGSHALGK